MFLDRSNSEALWWRKFDEKELVIHIQGIGILLPNLSLPKNTDVVELECGLGWSESDSPIQRQKIGRRTTLDRCGKSSAFSSLHWINADTFQCGRNKGKLKSQNLGILWLCYLCLEIASNWDQGWINLYCRSSRSKRWVLRQRRISSNELSRKNLDCSNPAQLCQTVEGAVGIPEKRQ